MINRNLTAEEEAEEIRKKYTYRQLILSGRLVLPYNRAAQLLGPDCLYRLYALTNSANAPRRRQKEGRPRRAPAKRRMRNPK